MEAKLAYIYIVKNGAKTKAGSGGKRGNKTSGNAVTRETFIPGGGSNRDKRWVDGGNNRREVDDEKKRREASGYGENGWIR